MTGCCDCEPVDNTDYAYRRVLHITLTLNAIMFLVESVAGYVSNSSALQADSLDFLGDALNYVSALYVLNKSMRWKSGAALVKGGMIGVFGLLVLGNAVYHLYQGTVPVAETMGVIAVLAFATNACCARLLFKFRKGDSNRSSVWICSRNDAIANLLVLIAGAAVYFTCAQWPDLAVSFIIASLAILGAITIIRQARTEMKHDRQAIS